MRVLVLTQHFPPEITAGSFRLEAFAAALSANGHQVEVICPVPNHPKGVIEEGYGDRFVERRAVADSAVRYVRVPVSREKTFRTRLSYYGSYAALATVLGAVGRRPAALVASSPPLSVAAAGALLAARHRVPLIADIRDLWPDSALELGELETEAVLPRRCAVSSVGSMRERLQSSPRTTPFAPGSSRVPRRTRGSR